MKDDWEDCLARRDPVRPLVKCQKAPSKNPRVLKGLEEEEESEEAEDLRRRKEVQTPSKEEIRRHRATHLPFRS